ncbi:hypothetical protein E4T39_04068 [Aureobasidium subglaciale]|nr:hypothetical protein E4T39_04068 [Aureobasidium subglaciale]
MGYTLGHLTLAAYPGFDQLIWHIRQHSYPPLGNTLLTINQPSINQPPKMLPILPILLFLSSTISLVTSAPVSPLHRRYDIDWQLTLDAPAPIAEDNFPDEQKLVAWPPNRNLDGTLGFSPDLKDMFNAWKSDAPLTHVGFDPPPRPEGMVTPLDEGYVESFEYPPNTMRCSVYGPCAERGPETEEEKAERKETVVWDMGDQADAVVIDDEFVKNQFD